MCWLFILQLLLLFAVWMQRFFFFAITFSLPATSFWLQCCFKWMSSTHTISLVFLLSCVRCKSVSVDAPLDEFSSVVDEVTSCVPRLSLVEVFNSVSTFRWFAITLEILQTNNDDFIKASSETNEWKVISSHAERDFSTQRFYFSASLFYFVFFSFFSLNSVFHFTFAFIIRATIHSKQDRRKRKMLIRCRRHRSWPLFSFVPRNLCGIFSVLFEFRFLHSISMSTNAVATKCMGEMEKRSMRT